MATRKKSTSRKSSKRRYGKGASKSVESAMRRRKSGTLRRGLEGHGYIVEYPDAALYDLTEEHGHVDLSASARRPEIGERLSIIPNHICLVSNLFTHVHGVRGLGERAAHRVGQDLVVFHQQDAHAADGTTRPAISRCS